MSDFYAVAGVSAVLKWMLSDAVTSSGLNTTFPSATISILSPDLVATGADESPQLNLFMYYASVNSAYRNVGLPSRDSQGNRIANPPLALNLHYLVSAYGKTELDPEILLAWAMQIFHENQILTRQTIQNQLAAMASSHGATIEMQAVAKTPLANQVEQLKIIPEALSNEEISKLWMAFNTHYRPTTSYQVSVVLIEETRPIKSNMPVQTRQLLAIPGQAPEITSINPASVATNKQLTINGQYLLGDNPRDTVVVIDDITIVPDVLQSNCLKITIPASLPAGVRKLRVVRGVSFRTGGVAHPGFTSAPFLFALTPTITTAPPITIKVGNTLSLNVSPDIGSNQRATLFIGNMAVSRDLVPAGAPATSTTVSFTIPKDFPASASPQALRLQVDNVDSPLNLDQIQGSSSFGQFLPQAMVTP